MNSNSNPKGIPMSKRYIASALVALSLIGGAAATLERNFFLRSLAGQPPEAREDEIAVEVDIVDEVDVDMEDMEIAEVEAFEGDAAELDDSAAFDADMQDPQKIFLANANPQRELALFESLARNRAESLARNRQPNPQDAVQIELNAKLKKLLREYQQAKPDQRPAMRADIAEVVNSQFSNKLESQQKRLDRLREEANQIEAHLQKRRELSASIVDRRVKELLGEKDELSWDEEKFVPFSGFDSTPAQPWLSSVDALNSARELNSARVLFNRDQSLFKRYQDELSQDRNALAQTNAEAEASHAGARREASMEQKRAMQERKRAMQEQLQEMQKQVEKQRLLIEQQLKEINE